MSGSKPKHRMAECHPDQPHHGNGKCKRCAQREWFRVNGRKPKVAKPPRNLYPYEHCRIENGPKGWGYL